MDAELKKTIDAIRENTGIAVSVYTGRGEPLFGAEGKAPSGFEGVFRDAERNVTFFRAAHRGRQYICSVAGCTDVQRNYAYLIADMVANAGSRVPGTANLPKGEFLRRILLPGGSSGRSHPSSGPWSPNIHSQRPASPAKKFLFLY